MSRFDFIFTLFKFYVLSISIWLLECINALNNGVIVLFMSLDDLEEGRLFILAGKIVSDRYHTSSGIVVNRPGFEQEWKEVQAERDRLRSVIKTNADFLDYSRRARLTQSISSVRTLINSSDGNGYNGSVYHFLAMSSLAGYEQFGKVIRIAEGLVEADDIDKPKYSIYTDPQVKKMKPADRLRFEAVKRADKRDFFE